MTDHDPLEAALREVGETLLSVEAAIRRAEAAQSQVAALDTDPNLVVALGRAVDRLKTVRAQLHQDGYLATAQQKLL